jgi:hypothetical protein
VPIIPPDKNIVLESSEALAALSGSINLRFENKNAITTVAKTSKNPSTQR